eukprot:CAMPEP_0115293864 /NCGR_PEP_ID=MMETSP0270-20121206/65885_1 /TAXON_ID=71861 /ORGANISM="Scrippsiella trochoidea, Strain CCMP3099" /LENGTH=170 /DNA_ID=CAMNT_0002711369 /DNA_START=83 /DNA_END=595 /DNA_ORIENTATION=+
MEVPHRTSRYTISSCDRTRVEAGHRGGCVRMELLYDIKIAEFEGRPSLMTVLRIAQSLRLLDRRVIRHVHVGAMPFHEAIAAIELIASMCDLPIERHLSMGLEIMVRKAVLDQAVCKPGQCAPNPEIRVSVLGGEAYRCPTGDLFHRHGLAVAIEWRFAKAGMLRAIHRV